MVDRFVSAPLELPRDGEPFTRADLIFGGVDHSGDSFEARIFLDAPRADHRAGTDHPAYVGRFFVLGHGGCFGDVGHCDVPSLRDPFDLRPPHQLEPATRIVTVTEAISALVGTGTEAVTVTVVAHTPREASNAVLAFDVLRLAVYA
jgi:tyrosinase